MSLAEALGKLATLLVRRGEQLANPLLLMLAGSNGAGKSTFYDAYLAPLGVPFINADRIAAELREGMRVWPKNLTGLPWDEAARRLADEERQASILLRRSFATETVLSDPVGAKVAMLDDARERGFIVWLVFIGISSAELSLARVRERVRSRAGHDVPAERIRARYPRTLANLPGAVTAASVAVLLDNDLPDQPFRFVVQFENGIPVRASGLKPQWAERLLRGAT